MRRMKMFGASIALLATLGACAQTPMGPHVQVMPPANKPFEQFAAEKAMCKQYAEDEVNGQADNANSRAILATIIGAGLGAGLGAAVGGGHGAAIGAAGGGVAGTVVGASNSDHSQHGIQRQYDNAFAQCMQAKGNQVQYPHVVAPVVVAPPPVVYAPPPPVVYAPPPPVVYQPVPAYPAY